MPIHLFTDYPSLSTRMRVFMGSMKDIDSGPGSCFTGCIFSMVMHSGAVRSRPGCVASCSFSMNENMALKQIFTVTSEEEGGTYPMFLMIL